MLNDACTLKENPIIIPKVLIEAKKEVNILTSNKRQPWDKAWEKGPWDKGHWANRK
ncbi:MAG: hypothetical protein PHH35_02045 [Candidatus Pacebacteria bacterium]|jgi:hypothetical protein|nr:hypothetical protein [Candidatus Paceibacterota bacterium]